MFDYGNKMVQISVSVAYVDIVVRLLRTGISKTSGSVT